MSEPEALQRATIQALSARHFCLFMTVVIACLMLAPALPMSFCDRAEVAQTLMAGTGNHSLSESRGDRPSMSGKVLRRVMRMLWLDRACKSRSDRFLRYIVRWVS